MLNQVFPKILNTKNKPISLNNMKMQIRDWIFEMLPPIVSIPAKEKIAVVIMPANKVRKRHLLPDLYLGKAINQSNSWSMNREILLHFSPNNQGNPMELARRRERTILLRMRWIQVWVVVPFMVLGLSETRKDRMQLIKAIQIYLDKSKSKVINLLLCQLYPEIALHLEMGLNLQRQWLPMAKRKGHDQWSIELIDRSTISVLIVTILRMDLRRKASGVLWCLVDLTNRWEAW